MTVSYTTSQDWTSGLEGVVTIVNTLSRPLTDWRLTFRYAGTTNTLRSAVRLDAKDGAVVVGPAAWNTAIAPGASVTVGFTASPAVAVTWGEHMTVLPDHGIITALLGAGIGDSTYGVGSPLTDDEFWTQAVQEHYLAHPTPLPSTTAAQTAVLQLLLGQ